MMEGAASFTILCLEKFGQKVTLYVSFINYCNFPISSFHMSSCRPAFSTTLLILVSQPPLDSHFIHPPVTLLMPFSSPPLFYRTVFFPFVFCYFLLLQAFTIRRDSHNLTTVLWKKNTYVNLMSVQECGQPVGSGTGEIQPGQRVHAGRSNRGAGGFCHDAGGRAATLLQGSHWVVQNRCRSFTKLLLSPYMCWLLSQHCK